MKKHHWHAFWHEKLFKKHPQPHCQTHSKIDECSTVAPVIFFKLTFFCLRMKNCLILNQWYFYHFIYGGFDIIVLFEGILIDSIYL